MWGRLMGPFDMAGTVRFHQHGRMLQKTPSERAIFNDNDDTVNKEQKRTGAAAGNDE